MEELKEFENFIYNSIMNEIQSCCKEMEKDFAKGKPLDEIIEHSPLPSYVVAGNTNIPFKKEEFIVPVQFLVEGYVKVPAYDVTDAIASTIKERDTIKFDCTKISPAISTSDDRVTHIVEDSSIVDNYTRLHKQGKLVADTLDHNIVPLTDTFNKEDMSEYVRYMARDAVSKLLSQIDHRPDRDEIMEFLKDFFTVETDSPPDEC